MTKRTRLRNNVRPFVGALRTTVMRKTVKPNKLDEEEILAYKAANNGKEPPKTRQSVEWGNFFKVYTYLIDLDGYLLSLQKRMNENKHGVEDVGILSKYQSAFNYIKQRHRKDIDPSFLSNHRITSKLLSDLEDFLRKEALKGVPLEQKILNIRAYVKKPKFRNRLLGAYTRFMLQCFKLLKYSVSTKTRKNNRLKLEYTQFKFDTRTEQIVKNSSIEMIERREAKKRLLKVQEEALRNDLTNRESPLVPTTEPIYVTLGEDDEGEKQTEKQMIIVGYDPSISKLRKKPKKKDFLLTSSPAQEGDELEEITVKGGAKVTINKSAYKRDAEAWKKEKASLVREVYSPVLRNDSGDGYEKYESYEELVDSLKRKRKEQFIRERMTPKVIMPKDKKLEEGERAVARVVFGEKTELEYELENFKDALDTEEAIETKPVYRQLTDREGDSLEDNSKIYPVKKLMIDGKEVEIISEGPFAGFKFEEMVNAMGRLVDNVYYDNEENRVKLVDLGLDAEDFESGLGFLEIERKENASGYTVVENRLVEPYVTVSSDGQHLMIGIPNKKMYKNDRDAMRKLKTAQLVKQVSYGTNLEFGGLSKQQQGVNPFFTFLPENFGVVKSKLGSLAISKPALDLIKKYESELESRNRALAPENVERFDASMLGGFKEEVFGNSFDFNDKQKQGMAWIEANGFKGVMSLDTGVGKTLFSGGTMQNFMNLEKEQIEEKGEASILNRNKKKKKFLFISPKKLVGNFTAEMYDFMKDQSVIGNRIEEMSYFNFARTVSSMNKIDESLKPGAKESTKKFRLKFLEGTGFLNKSNTKKLYEDADDYFRENYNIIFFDEVNEALQPAIKKSVSELEHPRKILLTASPMEKDPLDLYRFVSMSKGIKPDKKKEQEFLDDYANIIGGRFVGITDDVEKRAQFEKWVAENAFFALKEDVDLTKINLPRLLKPTYQNERLSMSDEVKTEYKKRASKFSQDLKGMVEKYRDLIKLKKSNKISSAELEKRMKGLVDYAVVGMKALSELQTLATNPEAILPGVSNPKIERAGEIAEQKEGKKILYFSHMEDVVKKNAKSVSGRVSGLHVAMTKDDILFFKGGEEISKITKNTNVAELVEMRESLRNRVASANPVVVFLSGGQEYKEDLNRVIAKILGGDILIKVLVDKKNNLISEFKEEDRSSYRSLPWYEHPVVLAEYEERKDPNQWAIGASKLIFNKNDSLRTISCTDLYARGFNFQFTSVVVHLDRGAGFDSEIIKQRTARAYRTKQDKRVEVIFLDATIAEENTKEIEVEDGVKVKVNCNSAQDQTIDEIQDLVQGVDQDFFMSIINKAMKSKIKDEEIESDTGEMYRMDRQLMSQIIDPTNQNLSRMRDQLRREKENPLLTSARDPQRFVTAVTKRRFNNDGNLSDDLVETNLDLSGMSSFSAYNFDSASSLMNSVTEDTVESSGRFLRQKTVFVEDGDGRVSIRNENLSVTRCAPKGTGTRTIVAQITAGLANKNVKEIVVLGRKENNTHYIWPKLGFNAEIKLPFLVDPQLDEKDNTKEGRTQIRIRDWFEENRRRIGSNGEVCLLDLYSCVDLSGDLIGQQYWKENGTDVELKIDLSNPRNSSLKFFNNYFLRKCEELEVETNEYLSLKVEPFDVDQPACWLDFLKNSDEILDERGNPSDPLKVINEYFEAFVFAYLSRGEIRRRSSNYLERLPKSKLERLQRLKSVQELNEEGEDLFSDPIQIQRYANELVMREVHDRETKTLDDLWKTRSKTISANVAYAEILESDNLDVEAQEILEKE